MRTILYKVRDILCYESNFFTDVERCILIDMINKSLDRNPMYWRTPFIYTKGDYHKMGFRDDLFDKLISKLIEFDLVTRSSLPYMSAWVYTYLFHVRRLLEVCEKNKSVFSQKKPLTFQN